MLTPVARPGERGQAFPGRMSNRQTTRLKPRKTRLCPTATPRSPRKDDSSSVAKRGRSPTSPPAWASPALRLRELQLIRVGVPAVRAAHRTRCPFSAASEGATLGAGTAFPARCHWSLTRLFAGVIGTVLLSPAAAATGGEEASAAGGDRQGVGAFPWGSVYDLCPRRRLSPFAESLWGRRHLEAAGLSGASSFSAWRAFHLIAMVPRSPTAGTSASASRVCWRPTAASRRGKM